MCTRRRVVESASRRVRSTSCIRITSPQGRRRQREKACARRQDCAHAAFAGSALAAARSPRAVSSTAARAFDRSVSDATAHRSHALILQHRRHCSSAAACRGKPRGDLAREASVVPPRAQASPLLDQCIIEPARIVHPWTPARIRKAAWCQPRLTCAVISRQLPLMRA